MPDKGWLKVVLEQARKDVNSRPDWQKNRVLAAADRSKLSVNEPPPIEKSAKQ